MRRFHLHDYSHEGDKHLGYREFPLQPTTAQMSVLSYCSQFADFTALPNRAKNGHADEARGSGRAGKEEFVNAK